MASELWLVRHGPTAWSNRPWGEAPDQVAERLDRVVARAHEVDGLSLAFGHGHAMRALAARWLGLPVSEGRRWRLDTARLSVLGYEREQPVILRWNS